MFLVFDIGATKTRLAVSEDKKSLRGEPVIFPTQQDWSEAEEKISTAIRGLGQKFDAVCGGLPGVFDEKRETLTRSPNLKDWVGKPIKKFLEDVTRGSVSLYHDTTLGGLGEATAGAGKGYNIVAYITVSTGVGGTRIVGGRPDETSIGSQPGHQILNMKTLASLENLISGATFKKRYGSEFVTLTSKEEWEEAARTLAIGIHNTIVHWSPEIVVLGGSMMTSKISIPIESVRKYLKEITTIFPDVPPLKLSTLGDQNGLIGALSCL